MFTVFPAAVIVVPANIVIKLKQQLQPKVPINKHSLRFISFYFMPIYTNLITAHHWIYIIILFSVTDPTITDFKRFKPIFATPNIKFACHDRLHIKPRQTKQTKRRSNNNK